GRVFCDVRHTLVAGNMLVFRKGQRILFQIIFAASVLLGFAGKFSLKQGGTAEIYPSLAEFFSVGTVFY
ncbi:hypothetical protein, partial [Thomasclavelia cocleata]|uniref:hypothetical protein n=1 Tax=Thomasclavelia cocleata TaxID=69824 RepID=UPI00255ACF69